MLISIYIGLRFEFKYAVPVLIALSHDLLITAGVYAIFGREVTTATVAALLTILGYSLYDTIIVFDRIRENVPRMPRATYSQIVNRSMSEVLTRSLVTSFSALMPIIALMVFGGETLRDFAFALMVGVFSGAYSSIFIAAPVLVEWKEREPLYRRRRRRVKQANAGWVPPFADMGEAPSAEDRRPDKVAATNRPARPAPPPAARPETPQAEPPPAAPTVTEDPPARPEGDGAGDGEPAPRPSRTSSTSSTSSTGGKSKSKQRRSRNRKHGRR